MRQKGKWRRAAFRGILAPLSAARRAELRERQALSIPPLPSTLLDQIGGPLRLLAEAVLERAGRKSDDRAVRTQVGAVLGVCLSAMLAAADDPDADIFLLVDEAMARLEAGLPLYFAHRPLSPHRGRQGVHPARP